MELLLLFLADSDFVGGCLRRNTEGHEVCMTDPNAHTRSKSVKVKGSAKAVKNKCILRNIKPDDGKWITITDSGKTAVLSVYIKN